MLESMQIVIMVVILSSARLQDILFLTAPPRLYIVESASLLEDNFVTPACPNPQAPLEDNFVTSASPNPRAPLEDNFVTPAGPNPHSRTIS